VDSGQGRHSIIETILQRVTRIPLRFRRLTHQVRLGQHYSHQHGAGLEFKQVQEYQAGDMIRTINWAATARRGGERPLVNSYYEEKDLTVMLLVDLSASMEFGSTRLTKKSLAAEISASLVYSARAAHDRIGLLGFASRVVGYLPPRQAKGYLRAIPEYILHRHTDKGPANFWTAVTSLERWVTHPALVFVLSDFLTDDPLPLRQALAQLCRRHEPIALVVTDPLEVALPTGTARIVIRDLETDQVRSYSLTRTNHQRMLAAGQARRAQLQQMFRRLGIAHLTVTPHSPYGAEISQLLLTHHKRASA
jgi:uncharacterized protein (DUF58 family)